MRTGLFFLLILLSASCFEIPDKEARTEAKVFFDLKDYFAKEVQRLADIKEVRKIARYQNSKEEKTVSEIDFAEDLAIFSTADINRVAWMDKYSVDSLHDASGVLTSVTYQALEEGLKTRLLQIDFAANEVETITVKTAAESIISKAGSTLTYKPKSGYKIQSSQEVPLTQGNEIEIEVIWGS